ncbi:MAG: DNA translocase FtsK 4TM domain-containing protein [Novosphingobium sp.]|uniref:FtsK/SpoIIIE family DNA translocase n=1 Tax=Novosphingobium sp. TaxID=1874826 RepID=UPI0032BABA85
MATRPSSASHRGARVNWRAAMKRAARRSAEIGGAVLLLAAMAFFALALVSYHQTDPSASTAAGGPVQNWMGGAGAWLAERAFFLFGWISVLFLPLFYVFARKLWRLVEEEDHDLEHANHAWWRPIGLLLFAMALISTTIAIVVPQGGDAYPAGWGGIAGLLGSGAVHWVAGSMPDGFGWIFTTLAALIALGAGAIIAGRIFAIDWASLLTLPRFMLRERRTAADDGSFISTAPARTKRDRAQPPQLLGEPRKAPEITDPARAARPAPPVGPGRQRDRFDASTLPSLDLLRDPPPASLQKIDKLALERNARLLETVLDDFNVKGTIDAVRTGPVVTMYELEPAPGTKASRVIGLGDDIARNMSAISARISSIPGRTVMGIELPNADRQMVSFKELVACEKFANSKAQLPIILGKDIAGEPIVADLATMPHLLVAGTTGSGKSVGLNCILLSLLYRLTPAQCRMILVDPKVLELKSYDDIPHLLSPVVTEPAKAVRALKWAVEEMERRYRQMSELSVRNITGFNEKVTAAIAKGKPLGRRVQIGFDPETGGELFEETQLDYQVLPQIVVIVDELADLMVTVGKEVEVLIQRLAQKSRAAGIHLIMATQRPSVDVITGVIKANLPTRISFAVTSKIDSRTILGEQGAEQLLGKGDMLYKPASDAIKRVHGPFVSDEEVEMIADFWRGQGTPEYVDSVTEEPEDGGFGFDDLDGAASDSPDERKYRQACQIVFESQKASASWLQRQLGVGYNTAAKWVERMEADGFVGPANHVGRRDIYRDKDGSPL